MEGQEHPPKIVDIDDPDIPQYSSLIALEVHADTYGPTKVSTLVTEGPHRSARVRFHPYIYFPIIKSKGYAFDMTQLESQGVRHPDAHISAQEDFYQAGTDLVIEIMT